jgi:hypothetical protein
MNDQEFEQLLRDGAEKHAAMMRELWEAEVRHEVEILRRRLGADVINTGPLHPDDLEFLKKLNAEPDHGNER